MRIKFYHYFQAIWGLRLYTSFARSCFSKAGLQISFVDLGIGSLPVVSQNLLKKLEQGDAFLRCRPQWQMRSLCQA